MLMLVLNRIGALQLLVLAGDSRQLGPLVPSDQSGRDPLGKLLSTSILQRLADGWPQLAQVKLVKNYRGHPDTSAMANEIFYKGEMESVLPASHWDTPLTRNVSSLVQTLSPALPPRSRTPTQNDRVFFFDVKTRSSKEDTGSSTYNGGGIQATIPLVKLLAGLGVKWNEIGVISMYREDLRLLIVNLKINGIRNIETKKHDQRDGLRVASVDSFQGQQRPTMIVHFVSARKTGHDPFGLVKNALRLNVASTRSQAYQFFVGNMTLWQEWKKSISSCNESTTAMINVMKWLLNWGKVDAVTGDGTVV
ncbi:hypothetical protein M409DRAFT_59898 [Zasmidium cellare ATCC 36951]|uniref:DNA2/NAM7 helicase-like C-terminal domain-containing protein n=1 Tax=Zasmidium cellare ATCC 36951 TaxID=1080233 RepID=A0A6A6C468_ZASCE|nr:uncharacterized protein M409DRAFT_59898 [Zasmidium cellare ATCC 36951]KAF2160652.1 hypothetical protein M409DRAFT_59898 [Zasmidium cellare ATCC 36951]